MLTRAAPRLERNQRIKVHAMLVSAEIELQSCGLAEGPRQEVEGLLHRARDIVREPGLKEPRPKGPRSKEVNANG